MKSKSKILNSSLCISVVFLSILLATNGYSQFHGSLSFNGLDNYIEVENSPLNTIEFGNFTIEAWIKGDEAEQTAHPMILSNRGENASNGGVFLSFHALWGGSQSKMLNFQFNNTNYLLINNGSFNGSILDGQCHHVAVSRNGDMLSFYVDGSEIGNRTIPGSSNVNFDGPLWIGKDRATNNTFNGLISQCRIWNIARTEEQIFDTKDISLQGNEAGLIAYWEMNDGMSQVVIDKSNEYTGVLGSGTDIDDQDPEWSNDGCIEMIKATNNIETIPLIIYPNPTTDHIIIHNPTSLNAVFNLFDQTGKLILSEIIDNEFVNINLHTFPKGLYFITINHKNFSFTEKIVKIY